MLSRPSRSSWIAVAVLLVTLVWLPLRSGGMDGLPLRSLQIAGFLSAGLLLLVGPLRPISRGATGVLLTLGLLTLGAIISTAFSSDLDASVPLLIGWVWLAAVGVVCARVCIDQLQWRWIWTAIALAGVIQSAWSFFVWWGGGEAASTQSGTFFAPNQFAGYLLLIAPLPASAALNTPERREALAWGFVAAMIYLSVLLSGSRAGIVASIVGAGAVAMLSARLNLKRSLVRASLLVVGFTAAGIFLSSSWVFPKVDSEIQEPFGSEVTGAVTAKLGANTLLHRLHWSQGAILIAAKKPLSGSGLGTFGDSFVQVQDPRWAWSRFAHNHYAEALSDGGLLLFTGAVALPLIALRRLPLRSDPEYLRRAGLWSGILAGSFHMVLDYDWAFPAYAVTFVCAAVLLRVDPHNKETEFVTRQLTPTLALVVAGVSLAATAVLAGGILSDRLRRTGTSSPVTAASLRGAIRLSPYSTSPRQQLAAVLLGSRESGSVEEASRTLRDAISIDELDPHLLWRFAELEAALDRTESARNALQTALQVAPNAPSSYARLANFELAANRVAVAAGVLDEGIDRLSRDPEQTRLAPSLASLLIARARVEVNLTGAANALQFAIRATQIQPRSSAAWIARALLICSLGDNLSARSFVDKSLQVDPRASLGEIPAQCSS